MSWKYYLPLFGLLFTFLMVVFNEHTLLILIYSSLIKFFLEVSVLLCYFMKSLPIPNSGACSLMWSSRHITTGNWFCVWCEGIRLIFWKYDYSTDPALFMKRIVSSALLCSVTCCKSRASLSVCLFCALDAVSLYVIWFSKNKDLWPFLHGSALEQICTIGITLFWAEHAEGVLPYPLSRS